MDQVSCQFVLMVHGIFDGIPPFEDYLRPTKGIIMEYMPRGSIETLQENLDGPPPDPLAFRLAYEVALGMNFLHVRKFVHQDLKPSNVLLTENFNAKLADFGLSIVSASAKDSERQTTGDVGGTYKYMPPEALLDISYQPRCGFDIYSYGIFLWSLFMGKEPYPACVGVIKNIFSKHERGIHAAVGQVLAVLDADSTESVPSPGQSHSHDEVDAYESARISTQELSDSDSADTMSVEDKVKFVDDNTAKIIEEAMEVMKIVDELKTKGMVSRQQYTEIDVIPEQDKKMRRLLIYTAVHKVDSVKAAFYTALKKNNPALVDHKTGCDKDCQCFSSEATTSYILKQHGVLHMH
ncbi:hypothetical protein INR49_021610 [Caranx melampygus]|nr:hypothetical protein INR49_021610 [Caranx melampygus]